MLEYFKVLKNCKKGLNHAFTSLEKNNILTTKVKVNFKLFIKRYISIEIGAKINFPVSRDVIVTTRQLTE